MKDIITVASVALVFVSTCLFMTQIGKGETVPVLRDKKKVKPCALEELYSQLTGLESKSTYSTVTFEEK